MEDDALTNKHSDLCISIALGTYCSYAAICVRDIVQMLPIDDGLPDFVTYLTFYEGGRLLGIPAHGLSIRNPANTVYEFKKLLGRSFTDPVLQSDSKSWFFRIQADSNNDPLVVLQENGQPIKLRPEYLTSMIFSRIKSSAQTFLKGPLSKTVLTVPCFFNSNQRQAIINSAALAGFEVIRLINDSVAGAFSHVINRKLNDCNILVFKMGAGSTEVSIMNLESETLHVIAQTGCPNLGGNDFSEAIVEMCVNDLKNIKGINVKGEFRGIKRLRNGCQRARRALSISTQAAIQVDNVYQAEDFSKTITLQQFESMTKPLLNKAQLLIQQAIKKSNLQPVSIGEVVMIGGATRMKCINSLLKTIFPQSRISGETYPDKAAAMGAAMYASQLCSPLTNPSTSLLVMNTVTNSFWLQIDKSEPIQIVESGSMIPLVKTHPLPSTLLPQSIEIYQGSEQKFDSITRILAHYIQPPAYGVKLVLSIKIDPNRILSCQIRNKQTLELVKSESKMSGMSCEDIRLGRQMSDLDKQSELARLETYTRLDDID